MAPDTDADTSTDADLPIPRTLLITLTGKDRPGVTSSVFATLASYGVEVLDIEQIVLRRRLVLGVLVAAPGQWKALRDELVEIGGAVGMQVEVDRGTGDNQHRPQGRTTVTVLGRPLRSTAMAAIAARIAETGANIDRIERMARYPVTAIELHVSGAEPEALRTLLAVEASHQEVDVAVQPANLLMRGARLIVMDVDSTLIQGEVIEMLAAKAGCEAEVAAVTERAMRGEIDFETSLRERVARLEGLPETALGEVYAAIVLAPGARTMVRTLRRLGYRFAVVSGGFTQITDRIAADLEIHFAAANELEIVGRPPHRSHHRAGGRPGRQGRGTAGVRQAGRDRGGGHDRDRRRRQRPRHALGRRARHRLQRQADGPRGGRHLDQRALPRHDHVPARDQSRGDRAG